MTRREAIRTLMTAGAACMLTPLMNIQDCWSAENGETFKCLCSGKLSLYNVHLKESVNVRYLNRRGKFDQQALQKLSSLFRCWYDDAFHPIDPELFLLLDAVKSKLGAHDRPYVLTSGYRSPEYNEYLRANHPNVSERSYHMRGMAADINIDGVNISDIREMAVALRAGGVGHYDSFVHVDVGPVRYWQS